MRPFRSSLLASLALFAACSSPEPPGSAPVLLVGLDGMEWNVMLPMLQRGELPHLASMMEDGNFGVLTTMQPTLSPIIWTSIATGRMPKDHGILSFSKPNPEARSLDDVELFNNSDRQTKAIWNIASDAGKKVGVIGWWMTFPVEPINGLMVSQTNSTKQIDIAYGKEIWKGGFLPNVAGQVWPPLWEERIVAHADAAAGAMEADLIEIFGAFPNPLTPLGQRLWDNTRWSFESDATYLRVAEEALVDADAPYDLMCVYLGGPDVAGHRFWRYYQPDRFTHKPSAAEQENLGSVLESYYRWTDKALGRLIAAAGPEARVIVVSDHGMGAVNTLAVFDSANIPANVNSGHHMTAPPGVWLASGTDIVNGPTTDAKTIDRRALTKSGSVLDVASTVLALMDLPVGTDFAGSVQTNAIEPTFLTAHPVATVPSHDTAEFLAGRKELAEIAKEVDASDVIRRLERLGYLGENSAESELRAESSDK